MLGKGFEPKSLLFFKEWYNSLTSLAGFSIGILGGKINLRSFGREETMHAFRGPKEQACREGQRHPSFSWENFEIWAS